MLLISNAIIVSNHRSDRGHVESLLGRLVSRMLTELCLRVHRGDGGLKPRKPKRRNAPPDNFRDAFGVQTPLSILGHNV